MQADSILNGPRHVHWAQLDGLRGVAVLLVLLHHFWPELHPDLWHASHLGVRLFFVLSGFLITCVLLRSRVALDFDERRAPLLARFYARRALRLMPAFYLALGAGCLFGVDGVRETLPWHALYASNFYFTRAETWEPWVTNHFWSLAVEEQFYLVWPLVVLFAPRRLLVPLVVGTVSIGPLFRWAALDGEWNDMAALTLPFAALDALGLGALLALARDGRPVLARRLRAVAIVAVPASLVLPLLFDIEPVVEAVLFDFVTALGFVALIGGATVGFGGAFGRLLAHPVPAYLGRISYGIYLYHPFFKWAAFDGLAGLELWDERPEGLAALLLLTPLSIGVAALSWHAVEAPLARLKDRLPYVWRPAAGAKKGAVPARQAA